MKMFMGSRFAESCPRVVRLPDLIDTVRTAGSLNIGLRRCSNICKIKLFLKNILQRTVHYTISRTFALIRTPIALN
jgi:hypothetical protein